MSADNYPEQYTVPAALLYEPRIISDTRELIAATGNVPRAVAETLRRANIFTEIVGDTTKWSKPGAGVIFLGDHRDATEGVTQIAGLADIGRDDLHFAANPYALQSRVVSALGKADSDMLLPILPRTIARDTRQRFDRHMYWRLVHRSRLPTIAEAKAVNDRTLYRCAEIASSGQSVTIYPVGGVMDATKQPWRTGIGQIIKRLPEESHGAVSIVPIRASGHSTFRLFASVAAQRAGLTLKPWTVRFDVGQQGTVTELLGDISMQSAADITETLRQQYVSHFV